MKNGSSLLPSIMLWHRGTALYYQCTSITLLVCDKIVPRLLHDCQQRSIGGDYNEEVKKNRRRAIHGVLDMHRTLYSCESIAETYCQRTETSVEFSIMMGCIDEEIACKEESLLSEEHEEGPHSILGALNEVAGLFIQFAVLLRDLTYLCS